MVWWILSCHALGPLLPTEHRFNATAYLSIVAGHVHAFRAPSPDLGLIEHFWYLLDREIGIMHVQLTNLQQLLGRCIAQ